MLHWLENSLGIVLVLAIFLFAQGLSMYVALPSALMGLLILLGVFLVLGRVPRGILRPWQFMLKHMSLFFVPAFVSIPIYHAQIVSDFWPLLLTITASTCVVMALLCKISHGFINNAVLDENAHVNDGVQKRE